ncbi:ATP-binding protein [bacterium]|nr:ATP-binding protein [bacterium]
MIRLRSFSGNSTRTIGVERTDKGFKFTVSQKHFDIDLERALQRYPTHLMDRRRRSILSKAFRDLSECIERLVPAIWLPVNRRLPITEEEGELEIERRSRLKAIDVRPLEALESVDMRLRALMSELMNYRLKLDAQLSEHYKEDFEKRVLETILYNKKYDQVKSLNLKSPPTQEEKEQLIRAFQEAGLLDPQMEERIDEHFDTAREALQRISKGKAGKGVDIADLFIIPLIGRTQSIVKFAEEMENYREKLFAPLRRYEEIVNSFLNAKKVNVEDNGELTIVTLPMKQNLALPLLSSGEKQILILLTQALLWEDKPIVYVVDEPELSLHVTWQEKLIESLLVLGKQIQIIVATHSPDIVGPFTDKVIDLSKS